MQLVVVVGASAVQVVVNVGHCLAHEAVLLAELVEAILQEHASAKFIVLQHACEGEGLLASGNGAHVVAALAGLHAQQALFGHGQTASLLLQPLHQVASEIGDGPLGCS